MKESSGVFKKAASTAVIGVTGLLTRLFLCGTQRTEVEGLEAFLKLLDARRRGETDRGLLTGK